MANVSPRWHVQAANNMALLLYLRQQYTEADEVLQQVRRGDWREGEGHQQRGWCEAVGEERPNQPN